MRNKKVGCTLSMMAWGGIAVGVLVVLVLLIMTVFTVPAGYVGVVTRFGAVHHVAYPGLGFKIPLVDGLVRMDTRTQKDQVDAAAASLDLQTVTSTIAVNYHLDPAFAVAVYQSIGPAYADTVVAPAIQNVWKASTSQYTAQQLIQNREQVRQAAEGSLKSQLDVYHVIVDNFQIVNFDFSAEFNAAIEAKQVAQQQVETAKQNLAKAEVDAQSVVAAAQGQADAQKVLREGGSLSPEYLQFLALQKWDGHLPVVTGGAAPFIDVSGFTAASTTSTTPAPTPTP